MSDRSRNEDSAVTLIQKTDIGGPVLAFIWALPIWFVDGCMETEMYKFSDISGLSRSREIVP